MAGLDGADAARQVAQDAAAKFSPIGAARHHAARHAVAPSGDALALETSENRAFRIETGWWRRYSRDPRDTGRVDPAAARSRKTCRRNT